MPKLGKVILRTPYGKYIWWDVLQIVDYVPKGMRHHSSTGFLTPTNNTEKGAIFKACKMELQRIK